MKHELHMHTMLQMVLAVAYVPQTACFSTLGSGVHSR